MGYEAVAGGGLSSNRVIALILGLIGAAACAIGSAMTWVELGRGFGLGRVSLDGTVSFSGLGYPTTDEMHVGSVTLVAALVGATALLLAQIRGLRVLALVGLVAAVVSGGGALLFRMTVEDDPRSVLDIVSDVLGIVNLGPGTTVVIAGGVALAVSSVVVLVTARSAVVIRVSERPAPQRTTTGRRYKVPVPDLEPNWFPDPTGRYAHRFWDGRCWTDRVAEVGRETSDLQHPPGALPSWPAPGPPLRE